MIERPGDATLARLEPRWSPSRTERNLDRTLERVEGGRRRRLGMIATTAAVAGLVVGVGLARAVTRGRAGSQPMVARAATVVSASPALPLSPAGRQLALVDGTTVSLLDEWTRAIVNADARARIDLHVADGPAAFDVPAAPARTFVVRVLRFEVRTLGARFVLTPRGDELEVTVARGQVQVDWTGGRGAVAEGSTARFAPPVVAGGVGVDRAGALRSGFRALAAPHDYTAAYDSLVAAPALAGHTPEDLMLAADAARLSGHPAEAIPFLRRLLRDDARDARAPVAAFTLGRILLAQLDRPGEAADAFATSRRLAPGGPLAEDALAREIEAAARAGDRTRARKLADEYAQRFPHGWRAETVRRTAASD